MGDHAAGLDGDRWEAPDDVTAADLLERLHTGGERTTEILTSYPLDTRGAVGGRFTTEPAPTLTGSRSTSCGSTRATPDTSASPVSWPTATGE